MTGSAISRCSLACVACLSTLTACSGSHDNGTPASPTPYEIQDVIFPSIATDDALLRLLDQTPKDDPRQRVVLDAPSVMPVAKDQAFSLAFHVASQARLPSSPERRVAQSERAGWQRALSDLEQLLGPERSASAHGVPYNGTAYFLVFTDAQGGRTLRVFTNLMSYVPGTADQQKLVGAAQPLELTITSAFFQENVVTNDGGPFVGGTFPIQFE